MPREYPRIGSWGGKPRWTKDPTTAPFCTAPGCKCRATRQPWIEVSWFRGEDERGGPVCREHSEEPPAQLLEWAAAWRAENRRKNDEAQARAAARKATAGARAPVRTWQHDETGRTTEAVECPGRRWAVVPAGEPPPDGGQHG